MLSLPVLAVLLVLVFGGLVAAGLPLLVGDFSVLDAFPVLHGLSWRSSVRRTSCPRTSLRWRAWRASPR